jgi:hypothetical protein
MEQQLMTVRSPIHKLDLEAILAQVVPELLAQPVRELDNKLLPISPRLLEFLSNDENQTPVEPRIR